MRDTILSLAPIHALLLLCLACSGANGVTTDEEDEVMNPDIASLRAALTEEGITGWDPAPEVRDELFDLGQVLFFDKLLSGNLDVSCATCHVPDLAGSDGRTLPGGVDGLGIGPNRAGGAVIPRNSPTTLNTHLLTKLFWDARVEILPNTNLRTPAGSTLTAAQEDIFEEGLEVLAAQALFPPTSAAEMRGEPGSNAIADIDDSDLQAIWSALLDRILDIPAYRTMFEDAYPGTDIADFHFAHAANAIAAFEAVAFARLDMPLADFLDGDDEALTDDQLAGGLAFFDGAGCVRCHSGPTFTDEGFHAIALPQFGPGKGDGGLGDDDFGRETVTSSTTDRYRFKTPSLLGVELTAPYGHAGQYATLAGIVDHYRDAAQRLIGYDIASEVDDSDLIATLVDNEDELLDALDMGLQNPRNFDVDQLVAFLVSLTPASAEDLSDIVPTSVPSGLDID